jgi:hypothetical protein
MGFTHFKNGRNPWLWGYRPQFPVLSALCHPNLLNPRPPRKISGYATGHKDIVMLFYAVQFVCLCAPGTSPAATHWHIRYMLLFTHLEINSQFKTAKCADNTECSLLFTLTLSLSNLNPYCLGRKAAFFQWALKWCRAWQATHGNMAHVHGMPHN